MVRLGSTPATSYLAGMTASAETPVPRPNNLVGLGVLAAWLGLGVALAAQAGPVRPLTFAFVMLGWVLSVMAHEFSHAAVAWLGGDRTVAEKGYLAFDPRRYGDITTSLVIPLIALALGGIGFPGGAVWLRTDLMRSRLWRAAASLAGPAATLAVLTLLGLALLLWRQTAEPGPLFDALALLAFLQAMALVLNLLPIPGLDGFNALRPFLPASWAPAIRRFEALAMIGLLLVIFFVPGVSRALFLVAALIGSAFGVRSEDWIEGFRAFRFWG